METISTETTTFHIVNPTDPSIAITESSRDEVVPELHINPSVRLLNLRRINEIDKVIQAHIDLKNTLYAMNLHANVLDAHDTGHVDYIDAAQIPQWQQGVDDAIRQLKKERDIYLFNAGEPINYVPPAVGTLKPDFDIRATSMRADNKTDDDIAKDRIYLGKLDGFSTLKNS